jgi:molybdate transport system permease protein
MSSELWQTLWLSIRIASLATVAALLAALPLAYLNARARYWGKSLVEGLIVVPMVLPPTVVGYLIIAGLGVRGWIGQYLHRWLNYSILFRLEGAVLAAAIVAMPLLYLPTRAAFAAIDPEMEDMARVMGAGRLQTFWHVSLPMALRGLTSGLILAFARALGEFGATVMVFGIRVNKTTLPVSIYIDYEQGDMGRAAPAVGLLCLLSMTIALLYNRSAMSRQD